MASSLPAITMFSRLVFCSRDGGIGDELPLEQTDAHRGDGLVERQVGNEGGSRGAGDGDDVGIVLAIGGKHGGDDLRFIAPGFGKQRAHRPVDQARGENFALRRAAFALEESAGNFARGIGVLAVVHGERKKIAIVGLVSMQAVTSTCGVAILRHNGAVGLLGQFAGFERQRTSADFDAT